MFTDIYDINYYQRYVQQAKSDIGQRLYKARWDLIQKYVKEGSILDYGCGPNAFNNAGPDSFEKVGYDINPASPFTQLQYREKWDILSFWDSLEHIPEFYELIRRLNSTWLFITCPNLEDVEIPIKEWKHYRNDEHIYYFDQHSLKIILGSLGYEILEINYIEGEIRAPQHPKWLITIVAKKVENVSSSSTKTNK